MYLGYQGDIIALIADTREELENAPCMRFTEIKEYWGPIEQINGTYYLGDDAIIEMKKKEVRLYRNHLLEIYVDPVVSNPLRWADLDKETQDQYINYRLYLLAYTDMAEWYNQYPLTFEEWKEVNNG